MEARRNSWEPQVNFSSWLETWYERKDMGCERCSYSPKAQGYAS